jgi:CubicO group peptidase (beta-lactamase class C family)
MMIRRTLTATVLVFLTTAMSRASAEDLPKSEPEGVGLSAAKVQSLKSDLQKLVDDGKIAGGVVVVVRHSKVACTITCGARDMASKTPMTEDTIFAIASMTKPITCVGVMGLVERGKIALDDPVSKYLPQFKELNVLSDEKDAKNARLATVPAKRALTIRDLLSHTSGISYGGLVPGDRLGRIYMQAGVTGRPHKTIADQVERLAHVPLAHQPGEGWTYGLSHDVLGRVIEVVSGKSFDTYLREQILDPLDMHDTFFFVPEAKRDRVATVYQAGEKGALSPIPKNYGSETFFSGGGGLFSTARDYTRFAQMLLNGGELDGTRILKPESIKAMTTNEIGSFTAFGSKYGLGFGLLFTPGTEGEKPVLSSYHWGGYYSTNFWVDPPHDLIGVLMTQVLPTNNGESFQIIRKAVDGAIER